MNHSPLLNRASNGLRLLVVFTFLVSWLGLHEVDALYGQLPSESELPGTQRQAKDLPGEETLPGNSTNNSADLPGEEQLPAQGKAGIDQNAEEEELAPIGGRTPILRLAFDGHTNIVRTLDLSDGGRTLISGGEDKDLHVWRRTDINPTGWLHRRTIRWPVTRGPRGLIYTSRLNGDLAAFAGYGAFGYKGEIRIVDVATGDLQQSLADAQSGHLSNVIGLAWSPARSPQLASVDMEGRLIVWQANEESGLWSGRTYVDVDAREYSPEIAQSLQTFERRSFVPVSYLGAGRVVVPRYIKVMKEPAGVVAWHLQVIDLASGESNVLAQLNHLRHVRSLSATEDGRRLVSCDFDGSIGLWTFDDAGDVTSHHVWKPDRPPMFVKIDSTGSWMLVGTEVFGTAGETSPTAKIQLWDLQGATPKLLSQRSLAGNVLAGSIDRENQQVIITQGSHLEVFPFDANGKFDDGDPKRLTVPARPVLKVAFAKQPGTYKIAFGWNRNAEGQKTLDGVFDLSASKLMGRSRINASDFFGTQRTAERWDVGGIATPEGPRFQLFKNGEPQGVLPLRVARHGACTTRCTLPALPTGAEEPGETPATGAVIVGTAGENGIFAYKADGSNPPELLRQFRDHSGAITSLSTSTDGNYLVSAAMDSTISVWNLQDIYTASKSVNRWGSEFTVEGDQLIATNVREDGPLFFRGVRSGDRLTLIEWTDNDANPFAETSPVKMRQRLVDLSFDFLVHLKFSRLGRPGPDFQSLAAWRPIATLFVDQSRSWAYWTPAGFYDASFNGHQLFGWQINHDVDQPVEYFRAAQFRKTLERPDVMRGLLSAGSLTAAMRQTVTQIGPPPGEDAIVHQIESKPTIELLSPHAGDVIQGNTLSVRASIGVPTGATLVDPKAFVSGVPAIERRVTARDDIKHTTTFEWQFRLPRDRELQLEVIAATESESLARVMIDLQHPALPGANQPGSRTRPRLHVLAIGASEYRDPQIQSLDFAADAAVRVLDLFRTASADLYQTSGDPLVNADATRSLWRVFAQNAAEELRRTVSPDDLVIMYLCGHGLRDRRTDQWYFVTADANYNDLMNDRYSDCIAFSDLAALSKLPCRKLAILDSCHSGAVQPLMRRGDLKSALRFLQDDVVITFTASEGDEEAAEQRSARMGRFSAALVDALQGKADETDGDPTTLSLNEVIAYVTKRVSEESANDEMPQHPTASPAYLLRTLELPLVPRR